MTAAKTERGSNPTVRRLTPEDAPGVAQLFRDVYGESYPIPMFYDAEALVATVRAGDIFSVIAVDESGVVLAHMATFRSAPFCGLLELGNGVTSQGARKRGVAGNLLRFLNTDVAPSLNAVAFFGESVTNHTATQTLSERAGFRTMAVEVDLMLAEAYEAEQSAVGRVSTLMSFFPLDESPQTVFVPPGHVDDVRFIYDGYAGERTILDAGTSGTGGETSGRAQSFDGADVLRFHVEKVGADFETWWRRTMAENDPDGCVVQVFLSMSDATISRAVGLLNAEGFFFGGTAPRWFDHDALLMQRTPATPGFDRMVLLPGQKTELCQRVERAWRAVSS